jgi:hypothetical protein
MTVRTIFVPQEKSCYFYKTIFFEKEKNQRFVYFLFYRITICYFKYINARHKLATHKLFARLLITVKRDTSMKIKTLVAVSASALLMTVAAASACTQEELMKDPSKAQEIMAKAQEMQTKYQGTTDMAEACKAYDELQEYLKK